MRRTVAAVCMALALAATTGCRGATKPRRQDDDRPPARTDNVVPNYFKGQDE